MADDKKISELPIATLPLSGNELAVVVQSGVTKQTPVSNLSDDPIAYSNYKEEFIATDTTFTVPTNAIVIFVTLNNLPTFGFSRTLDVVTVTDAITDDLVHIYGLQS